MIAVIVVYIQEGMCERTAIEGTCVVGIRADELRDGREVRGLDGHALLLNQVTILIDIPDALGCGIRR